MTMEHKYSDPLSDEEGETLSLRDLPMYGESDYAEEYYDSSSDEQVFDHFEFFSEEWSIPISSRADSILFCGKLIADKNYNQSAGGKRGLNSKTWKPYDQKGNFKAVSASNCMKKMGACEEKNDMLAYKITFFKSPTRSRWFLFLFGSAKIPAEMEIRDIRRRQIKKSMSQQSLGGDSAKITSRKKRGIGWWKLIRALGCHSHHHADSVINAS